MSRYKVTQHSNRVLFLDVKDREGEIGLMADLHWDNAKCNRGILESHLRELKGVPTTFVGDTLCLMQGKWDNRSDQNQLRQEHRGNNYLNMVEETFCDWVKPYANDLIGIGLGNHESSVTARHGHDVLQSIGGRLRDRGTPIPIMDYWYYIVVRLVDYDGKVDHSFRIFCHHGYGGGGEVTRGMIDNSRTRGQYDADVFVSGHIHRRNMDENVITRCGAKGSIGQSTQLFLGCSTYKDESTCQWHNERGRAARPLGGWKLQYRFCKENSGTRYMKMYPITL